MYDIPCQELSAVFLTVDQKIADVKIGFTDAIIANELPGVLNWILEGLDRLLQKGRLDPPACCVAEMNRLRVEVDHIPH